ncbi:MAG: histidine kinase [Janthinobacterium lividum]
MKHWLPCLRLLLGLLGGRLALAQPAPGGWRADPPLRGVALRALAQTPDGLLWLGTEDGVFRYDGTELVPLNALRRTGAPLPAVACSQVLALPNGDVWLGTEAGTFRFTTAGALRPVRLPGQARRVLSALVLAADARRVWLVQEQTGLQAYTLAGQPSGPLLPAPDPYLGLWPAADGTLWLFSRPGHTQHLTASGQRLGDWQHPHRFLRPAADPTGRVWLLSARAAYRPAPGGQLPETSRWRPPGPEPYFALTPTDTSATLLIHDQLVHLAWTPAAGPRVRFRLAPLPWTGGDWGSMLTADASGHWWLFNTGLRGAWRRAATPSFIRALPGPGGRPYSVRSSTRLPDGRLLVSTYAGLLTQAADSPLAPLRPLATPRLPDGRQPVLVGAVPASRRPAADWLTGCPGPFLALNPRTNRLRVVPAEGPGAGLPEVRCLGRDPATAQVWGGAVTGLYAFEAGAQTFRPYQPAKGPTHQLPPLLGRTIEDLWPDGRGHLWLATPEGVVRLTIATGEQLPYGPREAGPRRVAADGARCLYGEASGRVWVGTRAHGLVVVEPDGRARTVLTLTQGLPSASVATIVPGPDGALWLGTYQGLVRYQPASGALAVFTTADGLSADECNGRAALVDRDGSLLIGGVNGLHRVYPGQVPAPRPARPRLLLTARSVLGATLRESYTRYQLAADALPTLHLTPTQPIIDLQLALSGEVDAASARYAYRVPGWLQGRWLPLGNTPRLRLQGLPPGDYVVEIRAESSQGVAATNTLRLPLTVTAEWWQRPGTWALGALLALAGLFAWQRQRQRRQRLDTARRAQLAADLHDEVGALLTRVTLQADLLQHLPPAAVPARLATLRAHSQAAAATVRDIIWSVSPEADTLAGLRARMQDVLDHATHDAGLTAELRTENWPADPHRPLPPDVRQHVYLVFREAVTNVLRHAPAATHLTVTLRYLGPGQLALTVCNDGPVAAPPTTRASQGLRNMRQRADALGWQLTAGPVPDGGWVVRLRP